MIYLTNINLNQNELQNAVVQPLASAPASPKLGQIYCDSTSKRIKMYDGTQWNVVGAIIEESTNGKIKVDGVDMTVYTLPVATGDTLGGVKIGEGIAVTADGTISADLGTEFAGKADKVASATAGNFAGLDAQGNLTDSGKKAADFDAAGAASAVQGSTTETVASVNTKVGTLAGVVGDAESGLVKAVADNAAAITTKVDKVEGMGLSQNSFTTAEKTKLEGIAAGAEVNVQADWDVTETTSDAYILNKPTKLSDFSNDEGFIDNTVSNLANYYLKTETYTKSQVDTIISGLALIDIQVVETLPETGSKNIIYLVPKTSAQTKNVYDEYIWTGSAFEKIGDTEIDLSNYLTKTGDASKTTVAFTAAETRANIATGEALDVIAGKIAKYFGDLKNIAFTGSFSDLINLPAFVQTQTATLAQGSLTTTVTANGTTVLSVMAKDATTNAIVMPEIIVNGKSVTVSIQAVYANDITIVVTSL